MIFKPIGHWCNARTTHFGRLFFFCVHHHKINKHYFSLYSAILSYAWTNRNSAWRLNVDTRAPELLENIMVKFCRACSSMCMRFAYCTGQGTSTEINMNAAQIHSRPSRCIWLDQKVEFDRKINLKFIYIYNILSVYVHRKYLFLFGWRCRHHPLCISWEFHAKSINIQIYSGTDCDEKRCFIFSDTPEWTAFFRDKNDQYCAFRIHRITRRSCDKLRIGRQFGFNWVWVWAAYVVGIGICRIN